MLCATFYLDNFVKDCKWHKRFHPFLSEEQSNFAYVNPYFQSDTLYPRSVLAAILGQRSQGRKCYIIPCSVRVLLHGMLRKQSKCTYTMLNLIQTRVGDNQRWQQIQNPMPSGGWNTSELMIKHAVWQTTYSMKGLIDHLVNTVASHQSFNVLLQTSLKDLKRVQGSYVT